MTQQTEKQLFKLNVLPTLIFLVLWAGFFGYALCFSSQFFTVIIFSNLFALSFLFPFHRRMAQNRIANNLKKEEHKERVNLLRSEIEKETLALSSVEERRYSYIHLKNLAEELSQCVSVKETVETLSERVSEFFFSKQNTVILYLFHAKTGDLAMMSARTPGAKINIKSKEGDLFDQWVIKNLKPLLVEDVRRDYRFDSEKVARSLDDRESQSLIIVPLMVSSRVLGLLRIDSSEEKQFSTEDLRFLSTLADLGAVAIENVQLYERIQAFAIKDSLTGLYLRRFLIDRMSEELPRQLRKKKELSLLMIDIDYFKKYNDQFGHIAGDTVLRTLGSILLEMFNEPGEIACRYGGEEFVVLIPDCAKEEAKKRAEALRKIVSEKEIILRREKTKITVSIGLACFPTDAQIREELIQKADEALYEAKRKGRNRVCLCS